MEKNELTNTIHATLCPRAVLIAYTYEGNNNKYFLERRSIDARGRMGEGHPVTVEFMNELVRNYSETHNGTPHGRLPSNLLYADIRVAHGWTFTPTRKTGPAWRRRSMRRRFST